MAQADIITKPGASYIGLESTFGTTPSMTRMFPAGTPEIKTKQGVIEVDDERSRLYKAIVPVQSFKSVEGKFDYYLRVDGTQLTTAASTVAHPLGLVLRACLGNDSSTPSYWAAAGSLVTGSAVGSGTVNVTSSHGGARMRVGGWVSVECSDVQHPARVVSISTDTLTLRPYHPSEADSPGGVCTNAYTYAPAQAHATTFSIQHAKSASTTYQWTANGCIATGMDLSIKRGELPKISVSFKGATWTGPSNQSISTAVAADTMSAPPSTRNLEVWISAASGTTGRTHFPLEELEIKCDLGADLVQELGGTLEGFVSAIRTGKRPFATGTMTMRIDTDFLGTYFTNQTKLMACIVMPQGSGTSKRFVVIDLPTFVITDYPEIVDQGGRLVVKVPFMCLEDETTSGATTDLALAPFRIALI